MKLHPTVQQALSDHHPVVALESTVITHGLPRPQNLETARRLEAVVREEGAVPATIAVLAGEIHIGLSEEELVFLATRESVEKVSLWNLAALLARGGYGGTTVATTSLLAVRAGLSVFATGGIGGVHLHPFDESADLAALARTPLIVVSSGPKSILDLAATLERLESHGVQIAGFRTNLMPAFHSSESPYMLPVRYENTAEVALAFKRAEALSLPSATLVFNPVSQGLDYHTVQTWVRQANREAMEQGVVGKALTPFMLRRMSELSGGETDQVNLRLLEENARLAAQLAAAL